MIKQVREGVAVLWWGRGKMEILNLFRWLQTVALNSCCFYRRNPILNRPQTSKDSWLTLGYQCGQHKLLNPKAAVPSFSRLSSYARPEALSPIVFRLGVGG